MTEKEARVILESEIKHHPEASIFSEALNEAIVALEEIQQYREIEKRLEGMYGGQLPLAAYVDMLEYALKEPGKPHPVNARILTYEDADAWEAYKAIGTPEECREAVEKQKAKKPIDGCMFSGCPNCGDIEIQYCTYCPNYGQKLDWSEEPDTRSE